MWWSNECECVHVNVDDFYLDLMVVSTVDVLSWTIAPEACVYDWVGSSHRAILVSV